MMDVTVAGALRSFDTSSKTATPNESSAATDSSATAKDSVTESAPMADARDGVEALSDGPAVELAADADISTDSPPETPAQAEAKDVDATDADTTPAADAPPAAVAEPTADAAEPKATTPAPKPDAPAEVAVVAPVAAVAEPAPAPRPTMIAPVGEGGVSSPYGEREPASTLNLLPNGNEMHFGTDYARPEGTPIKAAADGTVVVAGWNVYGAGNEVVIDHGLDDQGNHVYSRYMHQSALGTSVGAVVKQGDEIGAVGKTGAATGAHLHFQVSHGQFGSNEGVVDPNVYLSGERTFPGSAGPAPEAPANAPAPKDEPAGVAGGEPSQSAGSYTVQPGESLGVIALRHGMTIAELSHANRDTVPNPNLIFPGQQLRLTAAPVEAPATGSYTVVAGDTLGQVAGRLGVGLDQLIDANRDTVPNPDLIRPGQQLRVPGGSGGRAVAAAVAEPSPQPAAAAPTGVGASQPEVDGFITKAAAAYGADGRVLSRIAKLESDYDTGDIANDWDINAINGTPSKGMFQFIEPTFASMAPSARAANPAAWEGMGDLSWTDWRQQALTTAWAITQGLGSHWATYAAAGGG